MPLDPLEGDVTPTQLDVDLLEQVTVEDGFSVGLAPPLALPSWHPLGAAIDGVLGVTQDCQRLAEAAGGP